MTFKESLSRKDAEKAAKGAGKLAEGAKVDDVIKYIEDLRKSKTGEKLKSLFSNLSDKDQHSLYKDGGLSIGKYLKMGVGSGTIAHIESLFKYESGKLKAGGPELSILYRFLVNMGILDKPSGMTNNELMNCIKKDSKFINGYLIFAQGVCMVLAPEAEPFIAALKPAAKILTNKAVEIAKAQHKNDKETEEEITADTKKELKKQKKKII